jgi:hypothetical protein
MYFFHGKDWLSPEQRKQTIRIAQLGERIDPNNSFYNWVEAICWYDLGENEKALDAFQRGSLKTNYNDGSLQDTRNRLYVQQLIIPPILEDRWLAVAGQLFPQYAIMRHANQIAIWQGAMQERAGNNQRALEIYGAQLRLSQAMLKDTDNSIGWFVARAMIWNTWTSFKRHRLREKERFAREDDAGKKVLFRQRAQRFADYAQTYGRSDLAKQALSTAKSITSNPLYGHKLFENFFLFLPISNLKTLGLLKWSGAMFLELILAAIVFWGFIAALIWFVEKVILAKANVPQISPKPAGSILCVIFVLICVIGGTAILLAKVWSSIDLFEIMFFPQDVQNMQGSGVLLESLQRWIPWVSFGILFFYCLLPACWKMRKSTFGSDDSRSTKFADSFLVLMGKVLLGAPLLVFQAVWAPWVLSQFISGKNATLILFFLYLTIPLPLILFLIFLWWTGRTQATSPRFFAGTYWVYALKLMRNSLALLIVVCSLAYGATSFASLPLRHQANASLDRFVKVGEVEFLRETMQQDKKQHSQSDVVAP